MKPKILVSPFIKKFNKAIDILFPYARIEFVSRENCNGYLSETTGIIGFQINENLLKKSPKLKVVARHGVGYDDCDVDAMTKYKVYLTHTPNVLSDSVADFTLTLILACNRKLVQADKYVRTGWAKKAQGYPEYGVDLKDKTIGIIGLGRIGFEVANRCVKGFNNSSIRC